MSIFEIHYYGFHPSQNSREYWQKMLNTLIEKLPDDSSIRVNCHLRARIFEAEVYVVSPLGNLLGVAVGERFQDLKPRLEYQLFSQLKGLSDVGLDASA